MAGRQQQKGYGLQYEDIIPKSEWKDQPEATILTIDLPGFAKEQIKVTYVHTSRMIKVTGERPMADRRWSRFNEVFTVPQNCLVDKIHGSFKNNVLTITLPKETITKTSNVPEGSRTVAEKVEKLEEKRLLEEARRKEKEEEAERKRKKLLEEKDELIKKLQEEAKAREMAEERKLQEEAKARKIAEERKLQEEAKARKMAEERKLQEEATKAKEMVEARKLEEEAKLKEKMKLEEEATLEKKIKESKLVDEARILKAEERKLPEVVYTKSGPMSGTKPGLETKSSPESGTKLGMETKSSPESGTKSKSSSESGIKSKSSHKSETKPGLGSGTKTGVGSGGVGEVVKSAEGKLGYLGEKEKKMGKGIMEKIRRKEITSEDKKLMVNVGVAALVIFALGAYVSYTFYSSSSSSSSSSSPSSSSSSTKPE